MAQDQLNNLLHAAESFSRS